jgi:outer membrane receptor protein involved in Fe transport
VPVEMSTSSYSVLDEGHDMERFFPDTLVNRGTGRNYGLELTVEKFFSRSYFLMLTASLYDARRTGSDGILYEALYNGGYALNLLGSKEFSWGARRNHAITVGGKITLAGGKRYTPIDVAASDIAGEAVYIDSQRNFRQFDPYFRADIKLNYRINTSRITHEVGLDLVNITDRQNVLRQIYVAGAEPPVIEKPQLGFMPIFYYRIDF